MTNRPPLFALAFLSLLLAGCGLIPTVPVPNPFGLDGAEIEVTVGGSAAQATAVLLADSYSASGTTEPFAVSTGDLPVAPRSVSNTIGLHGAVTVGVPDGVFPNEITLERVVFTITIDTAGGTEERTVELAGDLRLTRDAGCTAEEECEYTADGSLGTSAIEFPGALLTADEVTVTVSATVTLASDPRLAAGSVVTLRLAAAEGFVRVL